MRKMNLTSRFSRPPAPWYWAAAWMFATAIAGGLLTTIGPWYQTLQQPWFKPPDWAFGPIWTLIFVLAATAAVKGWYSAANRRQRSWLVGLYVVNGVLNAGWSACFFYFQRPDWALIESVPLWLSILAIVIFFARYSRWAAVLVMPYLLWVTLAVMLNLSIVEMNGPFG